jgi:diguanylate cyclase (GGDEF)-like protein
MSLTSSPRAAGSPARVLLVDQESSVRQFIRVVLELDDVVVIEAESVAQAGALLAEHPDAVVLDLELPDGDGSALLPMITRLLPDAVVVIHSFLGGIAGWPAVPKGDIEALTRALGLRDQRHRQQRPSANDLASRRAQAVAEEWSELCRWDPALPPGTEPPVATAMIAAVTSALERPQPIGWGLDPALEPAADAFGLNVGDAAVALAELICLREAFVRRVVEQLPQAERVEALRRLGMIIDRTMVTVATTSLQRLARLALADPLTGLGNRRAFDQDLTAELARAARHAGYVTLAIIDVDGLKEVNDRHGHPAGDELLRRTAGALRLAARGGDLAYRIGGDEFALILRDAPDIAGHALLARLRANGAPPVSVGTASSPPEPPDDLVALADARLYETRRTRQRRQSAYPTSGTSAASRRVPTSAG